MADQIIPKKREKTRACLLCGLIKSVEKFRQNGCDNCDEVLKLRGSSQRVMDCTSQTFDGIIAMMKPDVSWVARWNRIDKFTKGLYAMRVSGTLPEEVIDELADRGIQYRPRDGSVVD